MRIVSVQAKAHPQRKTGIISTEPDGTLIVSLCAPRVEGRANKLLIAVLAEYFQVAPSQVSIVKGHLSSYKIIQIL